MNAFSFELNPRLQLCMGFVHTACDFLCSTTQGARRLLRITVVCVSNFVFSCLSEPAAQQALVVGHSARSLGSGRARCRNVLPIDNYFARHGEHLSFCNFLKLEVNVSTASSDAGLCVMRVAPFTIWCLRDRLTKLCNFFKRMAWPQESRNDSTAMLPLAFEEGTEPDVFHSVRLQ